MGWLNTKWDELTGKNQKVGLGTIGSEYDKAQGTWDEETGTGTGAMGTYGTLQQTGFDMMDPNSARNQAAKARMESSGADAAAEASRLAGRNAAMAGGAPAGALAAQTQAGANKAQSGAMGAFNQYLGGQFGQGMGMVSGAANNMASMGVNRMNAISNQRQANAQIDSQATGFGANLLGKGLGAMFNPMSAVPIPGSSAGGYMPGRMGEFAGAPKFKSGGYIGYQDGDYVDQVGSYNRFALESDAEAMDNQDIMRYRAMSSPEGSSPEMWDSMGERGQGYMRDAMLTKALGQEDLSPEDRFKLVQKMSTAGRKLHYSQQEGMQRGGNVTPNTGGMLSQIMGPDGIPMHIRTRIGGQTIG
tara:strand:- start:565 stop:1641 length:1077 start_codon:yes stop_codon:yes gene_type:complete